MTSDAKAQSAQTAPLSAPVPIVFIDCSAIMRPLDHLGLRHALGVDEGDPPPAELASLRCDARVARNGHMDLG
jgi:hypothetical protein